MQRRQLIKAKDISQYGEFVGISQNKREDKKPRPLRSIEKAESITATQTNEIKTEPPSKAEKKSTDDFEIVEVLRGADKEDTVPVDFNEFFGIEEKSENISSDEIKEAIEKKVSAIVYSRDDIKFENTFLNKALKEEKHNSSMLEKEISKLKQQNQDEHEELLLYREYMYYLEHDEERKQIAQNGYRKVCERHTYIHRMKEMIGGLA